MRNYRPDSPQAMGRIVALTLMADGAIDPSETRILERQAIIVRLGLSEEAFDKLFYEFCEDMLSSANRSRSGQLELDPENVSLLLDDIRDPKLQVELIRFILDIVNADRCLTGSEATLVAQALTRWQLNLHETAESAIPRPVIKAPAHAAFGFS